MVRIISDFGTVAVPQVGWFSELAQKTRLSPVTDHHAACPEGAYHLSSQDSVLA